MGWIAENAVSASISMYCITDQAEMVRKVTSLNIKLSYGMISKTYVSPQIAEEIQHPLASLARRARIARMIAGERVARAGNPDGG